MRRWSRTKISAREGWRKERGSVSHPHGSPPPPGRPREGPEPTQPPKSPSRIRLKRSVRARAAALVPGRRFSRREALPPRCFCCPNRWEAGLRTSSAGRPGGLRGSERRSCARGWGLYRPCARRGRKERLSQSPPRQNFFGKSTRSTVIQHNDHIVDDFIYRFFPIESQGAQIDSVSRLTCGRSRSCAP